ncbi:site-specific integrase [Leptotrichia sp. oral taxon 417]|nr:site-specific integrase [Leptotrichia sp. oral taxon 417]
MQEIFEKASDSERIIYRLLYETAGRVNEVLNLKFKDIFYDKRKKINIVKVKNLKQRNEKATKEVLISDNLKNEIEEFRKEHTCAMMIISAIIIIS